MVAADEETMPALPTRASSREFGTGVGSGVKVLMAMLGGVALAGAGAAVAFKMGILTTQPAKPGQTASEEFSTGSDDYEPAEIRWARLHHEAKGNASSEAQSKGAAAPPKQSRGESTHDRNVSGDSRIRAQNHTDQETEARGSHKSGRDSASIGHSQHDKAKVPGPTGGDDDKDGEEEDEVNSSSADGTANETRNLTHHKGLNETTNGTSTLNRTLNTTRNTTSTATRNMTHNGTLNATRNGTGNASRNASRSASRNTTGQPHQHLACKGGPLAACQCLFACKVFGARPSQCSGSKVALVDALVKRALSSPADACRGMQCIVRCSKSLGCFDKKVEQDCRQLANQSAHLSRGNSSNQTQHLRRLRTTKEETCRYECEEEEEEAAARRALTT